MNRVVFVRVFLICVVLCAGLGMAQENPAAPPSNESVVARSTAGEITESELSKALGASTLKIRQQLYDVRLERLTNMMFEKVVSHAADKAGLPIDEYIDKEITSQFKDPDPAEVEAMLNQYRSRLPADESEARGRIEDFLREQDEDAIRKDIRARLFREAGVEFLLDAPRASVPIRDFNPVLGAADAPITLIEFSDFECPFCSRVKPTLARLLDIYGEHVKYSFKHLPLPMHAQARIAGIASLCANQQDKFWPFHDKAFANQRALRRDSLVGYATDLGLDLEKFQACLDDPTVGRQIDTDMRDAQALGLTGTPAFLINGRVIDGARPFENFEKVFDEELKRLGITLKDKAAVEEISQ